MGGIPSPEELADSVRSSDLTPEQRQVLESLYDGLSDEERDDGAHIPEDAETSVGISAQDMDDERLYGVIACNAYGEEFSDLAATAARAGIGCGPGGSSADGGRGAGTSAAGHLAGGSGPEGGAAGGGGGGGGASGPVPEQCGHLGLWPAFSMLNHSCAPNAVNFVAAGGAMLVLAAREVRQGEELAINYLGRAALRPAAERQAALAEAYGFACGCGRCSAELLCEAAAAAGAAAGAGAGGLGAEMQEVLLRCEDRAGQLEGLLAAGCGPGAAGDLGGDSDAAQAAGPLSAPAAAAAAALDGLLQAAADDVRQLEELIARQAPARDLTGGGGGGGGSGLSAERQHWLRGSAFEAYMQVAELAELAGRWGEAAAALGTAIEALQAVAPHSDLHVLCCTKRAALLQAAAAAAAADGGDATHGSATSGSTRWPLELHDAQRACEAAVRGRYGAGLGAGSVGRLVGAAAWALTQVAL